MSLIFEQQPRDNNWSLCLNGHGGPRFQLLSHRFRGRRCEVCPSLQFLLVVEFEAQAMINRMDFLGVTHHMAKFIAGVPGGINFEIAAIGIPWIGDGTLAIQKYHWRAKLGDDFWIGHAERKRVHDSDLDECPAREVSLATGPKGRGYRQEESRRLESDGFHVCILSGDPGEVLIERKFPTLPESMSLTGGS